MATKKKVTPEGAAANKPAAKAVKKAPTKPSKPATRTRKKVPLYADVTLGVISELVGGDQDALIKVSRNFVLDLKKQQIEDTAQLELGL